MTPNEPKNAEKMSNFAIGDPGPLIGLCNLDWPFSIFFKSLMSKKAIGIKRISILNTIITRKENE